MKFEVGKMYSVGGYTFEAGNIIEIESARETLGATRYGYKTVSGNHPPIWLSFFNDGSIFANSLVPVVQYKKPEILSREPKIVVCRDGNRVTASWYEGGKKVAAGVAKCSPEDTFDFATGARIAFDRLMIEKPSLSREDMYNETKGVLSTVKNSKKSCCTVGVDTVRTRKNGCSGEPRKH